MAATASEEEEEKNITHTEENVEHECGQAST